jgi:hypothetical protein
MAIQEKLQPFEPRSDNKRGNGKGRKSMSRRQSQRFESEDSSTSDEVTGEQQQQRQEQEEESYSFRPRTVWEVVCDFCGSLSGKTGRDAGIAADRARKVGYVAIHVEGDQIHDPKKWACRKCLGTDKEIN